MTHTSSTLPHPQRPSRLPVVVCCLLSVTASFDLAFLAGYFEYHGPRGDRVALNDLDDTPDDDDTMLLPPGGARSAGRLERDLPSGPGSFSPAAVTSFPLTLCHPAAPTPLARPGSEHARRNGLGAPLLC
jgi:hypothetical protein